MTISHLSWGEKQAFNWSMILWQALEISQVISGVIILMPLAFRMPFRHGNDVKKNNVIGGSMKN